LATNQWNTALYDTRHAFVTKYGEDLVGLLAPQSGERILDVGCGTGHLASQIANVGAVVTGIDSSAEMIEAARAAYPALPWFQVDISADRLPAELAPGSFDAIFSNAVLHWVSRAEEAVRNMAALLKPGGRFVVEFGGRNNIRRVLTGLLDAMAEVTGQRPVHDWFYPSIGEYAPMLERHGIEVQAAWLFDRPTKLEGDEGLRNWYRMFRRGWVEALSAEQSETVFASAEARLRGELHRDGAWWADYRRIRIVGVKAMA
jgi:trans-aconitate methyltransferase